MSVCLRGEVNGVNASIPPLIHTYMHAHPHTQTHSHTKVSRPSLNARTEAQTTTKNQIVPELNTIYWKNTYSSKQGRKVTTFQAGFRSLQSIDWYCIVLNRMAGPQQDLALGLFCGWNLTRTIDWNRNCDWPMELVTSTAPLNEGPFIPPVIRTSSDLSLFSRPLPSFISLSPSINPFIFLHSSLPTVTALFCFWT